MMRVLRALRSSRRHERGAAAILVAGLAVVLLGVGAIAVDMGQVYAKRASLQNAADMAALAAAAHLDGSNTCTSAARATAEAYLRDNWIDTATDPISVNLGGSPTDGDGFIQCTKWKVKVWAPSARVDYGLARVVLPKNSTTDKGILVPAAAEVGVYSPKANIMPAYRGLGLRLRISDTARPAKRRTLRRDAAGVARALQRRQARLALGHPDRRRSEHLALRDQRQRW